MNVEIPQCKECSRKAKIEPQSVHIESYRMKFVVHRDFAKQFQQLNGR